MCGDHCSTLKALHNIAQGWSPWATYPGNTKQVAARTLKGFHKTFPFIYATLSG